MAEATDCGLLLDVNNVCVSSVNHDFDPQIYLEHIALHRVVQCHLAGHTHFGTHLVDTRDSEVIDPIWQPYREVHN